MALLADRFTYDAPALTGAQAAMAAGGLDDAAYGQWYESLPPDARRQVEAVWGPAPGEVYLHDDALVFPGLDLGNVLVAIQPPRGFGPDPIGTYHAPDLPPPHHYLAFYRLARRAEPRRGLGRRRRGPPRQARNPRMAPRQGDGPLTGLFSRRRARSGAAALPVRGERPGRGNPGQTAHPPRW